MSTALRVKVTEHVDGPDPNAGPVIDTAKVIVHREMHVDNDSQSKTYGIANIESIDVTVEAPGYQSYVAQPYNLSTALAPPGQSEPPITRVSLRRA